WRFGGQAGNASGLAIAASNLLSAIATQAGSTGAPSVTAFSRHLSFDAIFFAAALSLAMEHLCAGLRPAPAPAGTPPMMDAISRHAGPVRPRTFRTHADCGVICPTSPGCCRG